MKLLITLFVFVAGSMTLAAEIGPAGCGLGNVLMGAESQILASTTNGTSGNQTFGITSGTSNCVDGQRMAQLNNFVESNKVALTKEAARGEGETLTGMTQVIGCKTEFTSAVKSHYKQIFSTDNSQEISAKLLQVAENNPGYCS